MPPLGKAEHVRRWAAAPVALLSSSLALLCVVSLVDVVTQIDGLAGVDGRVVGWAGVGGLTTVAVAIVALLAGPRLGAGPPLGVGAAAAVFGLAIGRTVIDDAQLALALVVWVWALAGCSGEPPACRWSFRRAGAA